MSIRDAFDFVSRHITKLDWVVTVALAVAENAGGVLLTGGCFPAWLSFCLLRPLPMTVVKTLKACFFVKLEALSIWNLFRVSMCLPFGTCETNNVTSLMGENQQPFCVTCYVSYVIFKGVWVFVTSCGTCPTADASTLCKQQ
jgi:hypothetical protein